MPSKRRRTKSVDKRLALHKRLAQIRAEVSRLRRDGAAVKREEFVEMSKSLQELNKNTSDLATQFTRISQIQAELDLIKRALQKAKLMD
jgi:hypothetical protein